MSLLPHPATFFFWSQGRIRTELLFDMLGEINWLMSFTLFVTQTEHKHSQERL